MFLGIRKKYWIYLLSSLTLTGLMIFIHLSPVFAVRRAEFKGPFAEKFDDETQQCLKPDQNLFRLDRKTLAQNLLDRKDVENVHLSFSLPDGIRADINRFQPAALIMFDKLHGIDSHCRLIPYDHAWDNIDFPILTGLPKAKMFETPDDYRVAEVIGGLEEIKDEMPGLYRQIAEIDFSDRVYVNIYLTTGNDRYLASSRDFAGQLIKLDMVNRTVARSDDGCYNLLFDGVVIKQK